MLRSKVRRDGRNKELRDNGAKKVVKGKLREEDEKKNPIVKQKEMEDEEDEEKNILIRTR